MLNEEAEDQPGAPGAAAKAEASKGQNKGRETGTAGAARNTEESGTAGAAKPPGGRETPKDSKDTGTAAEEEGARSGGSVKEIETGVKTAEGAAEEGGAAK